ncbi:MAG: hypothetical protein ACI82A_000972 [Candidatus Azotimanducaceae bacterium]|jgi:hypothetical protein
MVRINNWSEPLGFRCDSIGRRVVTLKVAQTFIDKVNLQILLMLGQAWNVYGVDVVPAIFVERVVDNWIAQDKLNLSFGHARFQLVDHGLGHHIALLNGDPVYAGEFISGAPGEEG